MYTSFTARNFRLFENLTIESLAQVNLVGGKNDVGKTALLEAMWIYSSPANPDTTIRVNIFRGVRNFPPDAIAIWENLFSDLKIEREIVLSAVQDGHLSYELRIRLESSMETTFPLKPTNGGSASDQEAQVSRGEVSRRLAYQFIDAQDQKRTFTVYGHVTPEGVNFPRQTIPFLAEFPICSILPPRYRIFPQESAERFGNIQNRLEEDVLLDGLRDVEPSLQDIRLTTVVDPKDWPVG